MNEFLPPTGGAQTDDGNVTEVFKALTSQEQPVAPPTALTPEQVEALVNRQVEQQVASRLASVDTEVERRVQSALAKRKNQADKRLAEEKRSLQAMAERKGWSAEELQAEIDEAEKDHKAKRGFVPDDDETPPAAPPAPAPMQPQPQQYPPQQAPTPEQVKGELQRFVYTAYGLDAEDFDVTPYVDIPNLNDPRIAQFRREAVKAWAAKEQRLENAQKVGDTKRQYGGIGSVAGGRTPPPANPIADVNDPDALWKMANQG